MKITQLAELYVAKINSTSHKVVTVKNIIKHLFSTNLDEDGKKWVLEFIYNELTTNTKNQYYIEKSADNKYYLILINEALNQLNGGRK